MNEAEHESSQALLRELMARQQSMEELLRSIESAHVETWSKYEASDKAYRSDLGRYYQELESHAKGRTLGAVLRIAILLVLLYVAYRVS